MDETKKSGRYSDDEHRRPDCSRGDFYCQICISHMNSELMWESHINGKQHLKNVKKQRRGISSKPTCVTTHKSAKLMDAIRDVCDPIVGLGYMTELQRADPCLRQTYKCHLCGGSYTWCDVIQHILGTKHRLALMRVVDPEQHNMISTMGLSKLSHDNIVEEWARNHEREKGYGKMEVMVEMPKMAEPSSKRRNKENIRPAEHDSSRRRKRSRSPRYSHHSASYKSKRDSSHDRSRHDLHSPKVKSPSPQPLNAEASTTSGLRTMENMSTTDWIRLIDDTKQVSGDEVSKVKALITSISQELLKDKINNLPPELQKKLAHLHATGKIESFLHELCQCLEKIFDGICTSTPNSQSSSSTKRLSS